MAEPDPLLGDEPCAVQFRKMLHWLASQYRLLPLDEAVDRLAQGTLPPAAACITFDDGYRDNHDVAAPLLKAAGVPAAFFVASGYLDGGLMWNDAVLEAIRRCRRRVLQLPMMGLPELVLGDDAARSSAAARLVVALKYLPAAQRQAAVAEVVQACAVDLPSDVMMSGAQVRRLADEGFVIGAHTRSHPILCRLPDAEAQAELHDGRADLERLTGRPVRFLAYPNGRWEKDFDARHVNQAREAGFEAAFTTEPGVCTRDTPHWALPRFTPWDRRELRFRAQLLANQRRRSLLALPADSAAAMPPQRTSP